MEFTAVNLSNLIKSQLICFESTLLFLNDLNSKSQIFLRNFH